LCRINNATEVFFSFLFPTQETLPQNDKKMELLKQFLQRLSLTKTLQFDNL